MPKMPSVNETIQDASIRHSHYIYRYQTYEVNRALSIVNDAQKEITELLLKNADRKNWTTEYREDLLTEINGIQNQYQKELNSMLNKDMKDLTVQEQQWNLNLLSETLKPYKRIIISDRIIPPNLIYAMSKDSYMMFDDGTTLKPREFIKKFFDADTGQILQTVRQGTLTGQTGQQISRNIVNTFNAQRNHVNTMVRSLTNHYSAQARSITGKENDDIIKGYEWVSILDSKTSSECRYRDGRVWFFDEEALANTSRQLLEGEVYPPAHFNCRSSITYITKSWRELGINIDEAPEGTRSSLNGYVPAKTTYYDWLQNQSAAIQKDVLGTTRYNLWQSGEIKPYQFYSQDGRWLTLKELNAKGF